MRIETKTWWTITFVNGEIIFAYEDERKMMNKVISKMYNSKRELHIWEHNISDLGKYSKKYVGSFKGAKYIDNETNQGIQVPRKKNLPILGMDIYSE